MNNKEAVVKTKGKNNAIINHTAAPNTPAQTYEQAKKISPNS